ICCRDAVGGAAGRVVQAHRQAHLSDGAAASPLRIEGLERKSGRRALLDYHDDAGAGWVVDSQAEVTNERSAHRNDLGEGNARSACADTRNHSGLLDYHDDAGVSWALDVEVALGRTMLMNVHGC